MATDSHTLGIDFGTSNSAVGYLRDGKPHLIAVEGQSQTMPTSVFFDFETRATSFGIAANTALINGEYGRFMRALKSVLGTGLMHEKRQILQQKMDFTDIIAMFLRALKTRAEAASGLRFDHALSGRPVHFHSHAPERDAKAEADLRICYQKAGFKDVRFMYEPEAAALANHAHMKLGSLGLIVDIGGGTSDFSLFRAGSVPEIIASHGVRVGGTDFDRVLSVDHVMPLFGKGSLLNNEFGQGTALAPNGLFQALATWEKIPFLYTGESRREVKDLAKHAVEPALFARLGSVLEHELGHDVAFAVESAKIRVNVPEAIAEIDLGIVERGLSASLSSEKMQQSLAGLTGKIETCAGELMEMADTRPDQVDSLIFVGGSSLMGSVETSMRQLFPKAVPHQTSAFTAVVEGLALAVK